MVQRSPSINNSGQVVGASESPYESNQYDAFLYSGGSCKT